MAFSGALTLTDLNDFITPSQACIKPVEEVKSIERVKEPGSAATEIQIDESGGYYEVSNAASNGFKARTKLQTAEISLNDCLACSGCITSAESVLISMQSHTEVLDFLSRNPPPTSPSHSIPVLSIAPQSLASLAASISPPSGPSIPLNRILARVRAFCQQVLGIECVFDTTFARHLSLTEHLREFRERKEASSSGSSLKEPQLPMLASACPGWVCYAEKAHGEMIPFMSQTKSPQQIMGTIVKQWIGSKLGKTPDKMYHVTVMPCYDKKLEASRKDFYNEVYSTRDVDCVLTTGELQLMMRERDFDLTVPVPGESDPSLSSQPSSSPSSSSSSSSPTATKSDPFGIPSLLQHPGSSSGSYLQHLISSYTDTNSTLIQTTRRIRNDYEEYTLTNPETGEVIFRGAVCYGFRNLQNVVRKVGREEGLSVGRGAAAAGKMAGAGAGAGAGRRGSTRGAGGGIRAVAKRRAAAKAAAGVGEGLAAPTDEVLSTTSSSRSYDYIEVMACPSGCVNGGGQIKPPSRDISSSIAIATTLSPTSIDNSSTVIDASTGLDMTASERWGDKEWVKKVEVAYWNVNGLLTPPPSPPPGFSAPLPSSGPEAGSTANANANTTADELMERVLKDLCGEAIDEKKRVELFRTSYKAVESEVIGLAVKW